MNALYCKNLCKNYKQNEALKNVTLEIEENKIIGLIGRNGAGKTTLLKLCAGYLIPDGGEVKVYGDPSFDNLYVQTDVYFSDEKIAYRKSMKLSEIMKFSMQFYENWSQETAEDLLGYFKLNKDSRYKSLSKGMKSRFHILLGLSARTKLTLFDELGEGLDVASRKGVYDLILKEYLAFPRTIILSSHLFNEIGNLLEEIIFLDKGEILLHKPVDEMHDYAVCLYGKKESVLSYVGNKRIIHMDDYGNSVKVVLENDLDDNIMAAMKNDGITMEKVSLEDMFIYQTDEKRGDQV